MDSIIITVLLLIAFVLLIIFRIISWSLGREILSQLLTKKKYSNMSLSKKIFDKDLANAGNNLLTMSLNDKEITSYPQNVQEAIKKKRKADNAFFITFIIAIILLILKVI